MARAISSSLIAPRSSLRAEALSFSMHASHIFLRYRVAVAARALNSSAASNECFVSVIYTVPALTLRRRIFDTTEAHFQWISGTQVAISLAIHARWTALGFFLRAQFRTSKGKHQNKAICSVAATTVELDSCSRGKGECGTCLISLSFNLVLANFNEITRTFQDAPLANRFLFR